MARINHEVEALSSALSGHGIDEKSVISTLGKWDPKESETFREAMPHFFIKDERNFHKWDDHCVRLLKHEFMRFKNAVVLRAMHAWERDARLAKEALLKGQRAYGVLIEIACTRSADQLLGARKAYHPLFDHSLEEEIATHVHTHERKLLVALASAYRYEGPKVRDEIAKSEAQALHVKKNNGPHKPIIEDDEVIRIFSTRSKAHILAIYKHYHEMFGKYLDEDLEDPRLKETVQCLCAPQTYFCKALDAAMRAEDKNTKKALTRVIVTRADIDMSKITQEYHKHHGVSLSQKIAEVTKGNYKDFLLALIARGE
ncbi:annexin D4-like [Prosopis cineraria]|uniref:annexin D4-like n=1 Tax=Prosopis cineraria TaxID=364024 RepID=UPI00240F8000|nr:annexin D4-like [Prosopis cineraria]